MNHVYWKRRTQFLYIPEFSLIFVYVAFIVLEWYMKENLIYISVCIFITILKILIEK